MTYKDNDEECVCKNCDRFVSQVNDEGLCLDCENYYKLGEKENDNQ